MAALHNYFISCLKSILNLFFLSAKTLGPRSCNSQNHRGFIITCFTSTLNVLKENNKTMNESLPTLSREHNTSTIRFNSKFEFILPNGHSGID